MICPPCAGRQATTILLGRATTPHQAVRVGDQTGRVAMFADLYGNLWDLIQYTDGR